MTFDFDITTPANTTKIEPKVTQVVVSRGILVDWRCNFPPGSHTLLHFNVKYGGKQVIPFDPGSSIVGNSSQAGGKEFIPVLQNPLTVSFITWNLDDTYEHKLFGQLYIVPAWSLSPFSEKFKRLLEEEERETLLSRNQI